MIFETQSEKSDSDHSPNYHRRDSGEEGENLNEEDEQVPHRIDEAAGKCITYRQKDSRTKGCSKLLADIKLRDSIEEEYNRIFSPIKLNLDEQDFYNDHEGPPTLRA